MKETYLSPDLVANEETVLDLDDTNEFRLLHVLVILLARDFDWLLVALWLILIWSAHELLATRLLLLLPVLAHRVLPIVDLLRALRRLPKVVAAYGHVLLAICLHLSRGRNLRVLPKLVLLSWRSSTLVVILVSIHLHLVQYVDVVVRRI